MARAVRRPGTFPALLAVLCPLVFPLAFTTVLHGQPQWISVETVRYDWNHDGRIYTFLLEAPNGWDKGGDYSRVRIIGPDGAHYTFVDEGGLTDLRDAVGPDKVVPHFSSLVSKNPVKSRHLLFVPVAGKPAKPFLLFLFGWAYASSPGSVHVIALNKLVPTQVLYKSEFQVVDVTSPEGSATMTVLGLPCYSQEWGNGLLTYDPYWVYSLPSDGSASAELSIPLSKEYNLKHYYGWAGPDCSESLAVVLHPPNGGKPVIMDAKKAQGLDTAQPKR